jgi:hypothetical protein
MSEWTPEYADQLVGDIWNRSSIIELLRVAHNAELATEWGKRESIESINRSLAQALDTEREENKRLRHRLRVYEYESPEPDQGESVLGYSQTPHGLPNPP